MAYLVRYHQETGQIDGVYESALTDMLEAQRLNTPGIGYLFLEESTPLTIATHAQFEVRADQLVPKAQLVIEADPLTIDADGIDECVITVEPWQACTLVVDASGRALVMAHDLTDADPFLSLTSDIPQQFTITLQPMPGFWAEPVTVEAQ